MRNVSGFPSVTKCLLCMDLKIGVLLYVTFEMMLWALMAVAALFTEAQFFANYDLYKFEEELEESWYYQLIFGLPECYRQLLTRQCLCERKQFHIFSLLEEEDYDYDYGYEPQDEDSDGIDIEFRFQNIAVNAMLMLVFISYFILSIFFLIGILKKNTNFLMPYIVYDFYIIWMSIIMVIGGMFTVNLILIRNCSIFASVKLYPAICCYSLFKKMNGKFQFSREVPSIISREKSFASKQKSFEKRKKKLKQHEEEAESFELV